MQSLGAKTIAMPLPAWVIGTYDESGRPNAMAAAWAGICCSTPPMVYFSSTRTRYTFECVSHSKAFTVNIPGRDQCAVTDYLGIESGRDMDKLAKAGLQTTRSELVNAPIIQGFPVVLECQVVKEVELGSHVMFVGEIKDVKAGAQFVGPDGKLDIELLKPLLYNTNNRTYYEFGEAIGEAYTLGKSIV